VQKKVTLTPHFWYSCKAWAVPPAWRLQPQLISDESEEGEEKEKKQQAMSVWPNEPGGGK